MYYLFFEDEHIATLGLATVLQTIQSGVNVQDVQVLGTHIAGVLGPNNFVLVDVEALEAHLIVVRAAVPLLARSDHAIAVSTVQNRGDENQGNDLPRSVKHRSGINASPCITRDTGLEQTGADWNMVEGSLPLWTGVSKLRALAAVLLWFRPYHDR